MAGLWSQGPEGLKPGARLPWLAKQQGIQATQGGLSCQVPDCHCWPGNKAARLYRPTAMSHLPPCEKS
eukprot:3430995-Karenia_brevis.AAC.1